VIFKAKAALLMRDVKYKAFRRAIRLYHPYVKSGCSVLLVDLQLPQTLRDMFLPLHVVIPHLDLPIAKRPSLPNKHTQHIALCQSFLVHPRLASSILYRR
jgi:hypothetical protein